MHFTMAQVPHSCNHALCSFLAALRCLWPCKSHEGLLDCTCWLLVVRNAEGTRLLKIRFPVPLVIEISVLNCRHALCWWRRGRRAIECNGTTACLRRPSAASRATQTPLTTSMAPFLLLANSCATPVRIPPVFCDQHFAWLSVSA